jgi:hypothetical protein
MAIALSEAPTSSRRTCRPPTWRRTVGLDHGAAPSASTSWDRSGRAPARCARAAAGYPARAQAIGGGPAAPCCWRFADQLRRAALPCFGVATSMFPLSLAPRPALSRLAGRAAAPRPTGRVAKPGKAPASGRAPESSATVLKGCSSPKESQFHHAPWISMPALRTFGRLRWLRRRAPSPGRPRGSARPGADDGR